MCRENSQVVTKPECKGLEDEFTLKYGIEEYEDQFVASAYDHPKQVIITADHEFQRMRWGLIPRWCKDWTDAVKRQNNSINAIGEELDEKASYRGPLKDGLFCVIPVSGFFEYHHLGKLTYPFYIYPKQKGLFLLAGLYEHWKNPGDGEVFSTFTIVTSEANARMAWIHNAKKRMPLILTAKDAHIWLDREVPFEEKKKLVLPFDEEQMADYSVAHYMKWPRDRRESAEALKPVDYPELALAS